MTSSFCSLRLCLPFASALLLAGCCDAPVAQPEAPSKVRVVKAPPHPRELREKHMQQTWAGQPYKNLLQAYGSPRLVMSIPARSSDSSVAVYERLDTTTDCIDAFTVVKHNGTQVVQAYFCR